MGQPGRALSRGSPARHPAAITPPFPVFQNTSADFSWSFSATLEPTDLTKLAEFFQNQPDVHLWVWPQVGDVSVYDLVLCAVTPTPTPSPNGGDGDGLSEGSKVAIALGVIFGVLIICFMVALVVIVFAVYMKKKHPTVPNYHMFYKVL